MASIRGWAPRIAITRFRRELGECQGEAQEFCDGRRWPVVTAEHAVRLAGVVTIVEATR
jgi:hypothetical protein